MDEHAMVRIFEGEELVHTYKQSPMYLPRAGEYIHITPQGIYRVLKVFHGIEGYTSFVNIFVKKIEQ